MFASSGLVSASLVEKQGLMGLPAKCNSEILRFKPPTFGFQPLALGLLLFSYGYFGRRFVHGPGPPRDYTLIMNNGSGIAVETVGLGKVYGEGTNRVRALEDVSLGFPNGEFAAIMGPSGSGKSTLLHILGALDRPSSGQVVVGGTELSGLS